MPAVRTARHALLLLGLAAAACAARSAPGREEERPGKEAKIRRLFELIHARGLADQMLQQVLADIIAEEHRPIPPGFREKYRELARKEDFTGRLVPIYAKHLEEPTVEGMIAFYSSTAGLDLVAAQPGMLEESMEAGRQWGQGLGTLALARLQGKTAPAGKSAKGTVATVGTEAKVQELLELSGARRAADQMLDSMLAALDRDRHLPPGFREAFREVAAEDDPNRHLVPIYLKHLDEATIDGALAFFRSPAGRAYVAAEPDLVKESFAEGRSFGRVIAGRAWEAVSLPWSGGGTAKPPF